MIEVTAQHFVRNALNVVEGIILKLCVKTGSNDKRDQSRSRSKKGMKGKKFHKINESENNDNGMDDLADQVQSLFYHDVHFNNVNTRMHTELGCEMGQNRSKQVFKVDMAYNNTPIKQYGTCSVKVSFKEKQQICKFYVVEHSTAILGVSDSEKLGLVKVNFDMIQSKTVELVHNISLSEIFKCEMESEFPELFKGIGCMDGEISIKLKEGAIPHVEPIRCVPHAMQEPLKLELDKLCKEGILHKVDISEPIEWLNSFVCVKKPNGKIRLCLDPMHLNKWIIRPHHSAKLVDDILHRLSAAKFFMVVDSTVHSLTTN